MPSSPVHTLRRHPSERVLPGDRVRHIDGVREGVCVGILDETGHRVVDWDTGQRETLLAGYLERVSGSLGPRAA